MPLPSDCSVLWRTHPEGNRPSGLGGFWKKRAENQEPGREIRNRQGSLRVVASGLPSPRL